ncbi:MAG: aliphatic sulfonate ABC transporter substrate-binding protein [Rhizobiaceae bacterium]|nr:aliphatic sulfonate ABC transporter substrate-binding protein [Rhizobiaceae bacterium]
MFTRRSFLALTGSALAIPAIGSRFALAQEKPAEIALDYAYYNPVSLLLKEKGWLEEEFAGDGVPVRWVLSLGSNKALEYLRGSSLAFGSTAGSAALVARAGGLKVKSVYVYSKPEWTALVTGKDGPIATVADLAGKSVAVTRGTDPHIFLLRSLDEAGLSEKDINPVLLQHPDGYAALASGQVDAWAGLDPHMAKAEVEIGAKLFHRNPSFNTYGVLNVSADFATAHPESVRRVIAVYERARAYAIANPAELQAALVKEAKIAEPVAAIQLGERTDLSNPALGDEHRQTFQATGDVLRKIGVIKDDVDVAALVDGYVDASYLGAQAG